MRRGCKGVGLFGGGWRLCRGVWRSLCYGEGVQCVHSSSRGRVSGRRTLMGGGLSLSPFLGPQVQVWSGSLGRPRGCLGCPSLSSALSVALSPDGDQVAVGYRADGIRIYTISSGTGGRRVGVSEPGKGPSPPTLALFLSILLCCCPSFSRFPGGSVSSARCGSVCTGLAQP